MFHLINSVYVNLDPYMDRVNPHYNVSAYTGNKAVVNDGITITNERQTQLGYVTSLKELTEGKFRGWLTTMKEYTSGRMMVWTDPVSYVTLAAIQLLAMDPSMDKEKLTYFLIMTKVELDSTRIANGEAIRAEDDMFDVAQHIDTIYKEALRLSSVMRTVLYKDPKSWSLEWRVAEYITTKEPLGITKLLRRILIRSTIMSCFEALFEVKHLIGNQSTWESLGCTNESLLGAPNVYAGMTAFKTINSKWMLSLDPHEHEIVLDNLTEAVKEAEVIFGLAGDDRKVQTVREQITTLLALESGELSPLDVLRLMFGTRVHGTRPCDRDCSKYNSALIGHFLSKVE